MTTALLVLLPLAPVLAAEASPGNGDTARVREFVEMVKTAKPGMTFEEQHQQVAAIAQFTDQELAVVVPQLIGLLSDRTALPSRGVKDGPEYEVCHRASWALNMAAGICLGFLPARSIRGIPSGANCEKQAGQLAAEWGAWWKDEQDKSRARWLADRLPRLRKQLERPLDVSRISASFTIVGILEDRSAAQDILAFVKRECSTLVVPPLQSSPIAELAATGLKTLARIGDCSLVPALVESAKKVNRPEVGGNTSLLFQFVSALNALTGLQLKALKKIPYAYDDPKTGKPLIRSQVDAIKDEAFAEWLRAAAAGKSAKPLIGAHPRYPSVLDVLDAGGRRVGYFHVEGRTPEDRNAYALEYIGHVRDADDREVTVAKVHVLYDPPLRCDDGQNADPGAADGALPASLRPTQFAFAAGAPFTFELSVRNARAQDVYFRETDWGYGYVGRLTLEDLKTNEKHVLNCMNLREALAFVRVLKCGESIAWPLRIDGSFCLGNSSDQVPSKLPPGLYRLVMRFRDAELHADFELLAGAAGRGVSAKRGAKLASPEEAAATKRQEEAQQLGAELARLQQALEGLRAKMAAVNEPRLVEQVRDLEKRLVEIEKSIKLRQTGKQ